MKNPRNGFVLPLLLVLALILFVGGGLSLYTQNKEVDTSTIKSPEATPAAQIENSSAVPTISLIEPSDGILTWGYDPGTPLIITGSNFTYECDATCDSKPHVFVHITNSEGTTYVVGNNGPTGLSYPQMLFSVDSAGVTISLPAIPFDIGPGISPGNYYLSVSVDGKGTSNKYPITIVSAGR